MIQVQVVQKVISPQTRDSSLTQSMILNLLPIDTLVMDDDDDAIRNVVVSDILTSFHALPLRYDITIIPINTTFIENLIRVQIKLAVYSRQNQSRTTLDDPDPEFSLTTFLHDDFLETEHE